jgi:hypothetical protein
MPHGSVNRCRTLAIASDCNGGRITWDAFKVWELIPYDEEHRAMVVEGGRGRLRWISKADSMVLAIVFLRESASGTFGDHDMGMHNANYDSRGLA